MHPPYRRFARNPAGRDFVVGDIHGMFPALRELLALVRFDEERDRLFSVGDLIDRGPCSREAIDWLAKPWFHAVRGNHEQFLLDSDDPSTRDLWIRYNGGAWWLDCGPTERDAFREACGAASHRDRDHRVEGEGRGGPRRRAPFELVGGLPVAPGEAR